MKTEAAEKLIERLAVDIYPVTLVKYILNRRRILNMFDRAMSPDFEMREPLILLDHSGCAECEEKKVQNVLCRKHTSLTRVLEATKVARDVDTGVYIYKNEIFRQMGDKLVIVYCPHPRLIKGDVTDDKVRKVNPFTIADPAVVLPNYSEISEFSSLMMMDKLIKMWFNDQFSLVTVPENRNASGWCLIANPQVRGGKVDGQE